MIDWIKFSERQPEKEGDYICWPKSALEQSLVCQWSLARSVFWDPNDEETRDIDPPEYWAEINPPKETPMPQEKETPKLCKDCRWVDLGSYPFCLHPKSARSLVNGEPLYRCESLRCDEVKGICDPPGLTRCIGKPNPLRHSWSAWRVQVRERRLRPCRST